MPSITERIMSLWSTPAPYTCIYTERIKCFEKLTDIQKRLKAADEARIKDPNNENTMKTLQAYNEQYKKEYELCNKIMQMQ
jgi:RPA family protein